MGWLFIFSGPIVNLGGVFCLAFVKTNKENIKDLVYGRDALRALKRAVFGSMLNDGKGK